MASPHCTVPTLQQLTGILGTPLPDLHTTFRLQLENSLKNNESLKLIRQVIDIDAVEQLVEQSQTRAIGAALGLIHQQLSRAAPQAASHSVSDIVGGLVRQMDGPQGLDSITGGRGDCARPRAFEIAAALNRVRSLSVRQLQ